MTAKTAEPQEVRDGRGALPRPARPPQQQLDEPGNPLHTWRSALGGGAGQDAGKLNSLPLRELLR